MKTETETCRECRSPILQRACFPGLCTACSQRHAAAWELVNAGQAVSVRQAKRILGRRDWEKAVDKVNRD